MNILRYAIVMGMQKAKDAYQWCTDTGIIDDISETFPLTSSGMCNVCCDMRMMLLRMSSV